MNKLYRILRVIPLAFVCAVVATAALRVQEERSGDRKPVPNRIGQSQYQESFLEATIEEVYTVYGEVALAFFPGLVAGQMAYSQESGSSLDALKMRNRSIVTY